MNNIVATISEIVKAGKPYDIAFPNLGIYIETMRNVVRIGNFTIAYYGIIIALAMLVGFYVAKNLAKKVNIEEDYLYDIFIIIILLGIIGARAYYVIFKWDYYRLRPFEILDIRAGGLAVYGGIILATIGIIVYCVVRKVNVIKMLDVVMPAVAIGQAIGRYGNFFNMEAFGKYTNNIFAMRMKMDYIDKTSITLEQSLNAISENGVNYIQAHPTFFYESTLNIILFIILIIIFIKLYKFDGQIAATYYIGYGIIRFFVESLRTDSLMAGKNKISQIVSILLILLGITIYLLNKYKVEPFDKFSKNSKSKVKQNTVKIKPENKKKQNNNLKNSKKQSDKSQSKSKKISN